MIIAISTMAFAGCTCGQGWRPNIFTRLHDRIHGTNNIGAPCDVNCVPAAPAPLAYAPPPTAGCTDCGPSVAAGYGSYETEYVGSVAPAQIQYGPSSTYAGPNGGESVQPIPNQR